MMSSAPTPPPLPITTPSATATPNIPFRNFISRFIDSIQTSLSNRRPWSELFDRSALSRPDSLSHATARLRRNVPYFRVNYSAIVATILAIALITNPFALLLLLSLLAAWLFLYLLRPADPPLVIFGRTFSDRETLGGLLLISVLSVFLTSVGSILISALLVGGLVVGAHAACRDPEDMFLDEQEVAAGAGLLSFFGVGGGGGAASSGPAVVAARV